MRWGNHLLKWWSKTQPTLALSSGEAELAAIVRATSEGLGMVAVMAEFGIKVDLLIRSDAVAAIGMVKRQGLGRVRHLAVADLWVQQRSKNGEVCYRKLEGSRNTSDIMTKPVDKDTLEKHLKALGLQKREGRHRLTPAITTEEDGSFEEEDVDKDLEIAAKIERVAHQRQQSKEAPPPSRANPTPTNTNSTAEVAPP